MTQADPPYPSMAPCLLLAIPQLIDPNFRKSVVLLAENQEEGSVGLVLNHPLNMKVKKILSSLNLDWQGDPGDYVWDGGPVMREQGWVLHSPCDHPIHPEPAEVSEGIFLSGTSDQLAALSANPPTHTRFLLGSSGWGKNQLETEIAQGWWLTLEVDFDLVFNTSPSQVWEKAFRSLGIDPGTFSFNSTIH